MKPIITKEDVAEAISRLASQGKKPTLAALHAALENRGSMSTLVRLKAEVDAKAQQTNFPIEAQEAFRGIWALAREAGQKECGQTMADLQQTLQALANENERLCGAIDAAQKRSSDAEQVRCKAEADLDQLRSTTERDLSRATTAVTDAALTATKALQELADARAAHAAEVAALQKDVAAAHQKSHEFELQLTRAQALLEAKSLAVSQS